MFIIVHLFSSIFEALHVPTRLPMSLIRWIKFAPETGSLPKSVGTESLAAFFHRTRLGILPEKATWTRIAGCVCFFLYIPLKIPEGDLTIGKNQLKQNQAEVVVSKRGSMFSNPEANPKSWEQTQ